MNLKSIIRWIFEPARFFLLVGIPLAFLYGTQLLNLTYYHHGPQRLLHIASEAYAWYDAPNQIPVSFLETIWQTIPYKLKTIAANSCQWEQAINEKYCAPVNVHVHKDISYSKLAAISLALEQKVDFFSAAPAAHFPAVGYVFYIIGAYVGLLLALSPINIMYLSIAVNAVVVLAACYAALRILPTLRWPVCYLLLLPTMCMSRVFIMPDALMFSCILMIFATVLRWLMEPRILTSHEMLGAIGLSALTAVTKMAYFPIVFFYTILPSEYFSKPGRKALLLAAIILVSVGITVSVGIDVAHTNYHSDLTFDSEQPASPIGTRLEHILKSPLSYTTNVLSYMYENAAAHAINFFTWGHRWMIGQFHPIWFFLPFFLWALSESPIPALKKGIKAVSFLIFVTTSMLVITLIYLHSGNLKGLQGRHFIPALPFLLLSLHSAIPRFRAIRPRVEPVLAAYTVGCVLFLNFMQLR